MPETPDPDPLTKVVGMLRTAVDDLARLAEHPMVKLAVAGLVDALGHKDRPASAAQPTGQPRAATPSTATAARAVTTAAKSGPSGRREQLLAVIEQNPGTSIAAAARLLGISPGGLYRIARELEADGVIRKEGAGWLRAS